MTQFLMLSNRLSIRLQLPQFYLYAELAYENLGIVFIRDAMAMEKRSVGLMLLD